MESNKNTANEQNKTSGGTHTTGSPSTSRTTGGTTGGGTSSTTTGSSGNQPGHTAGSATQTARSQGSDMAERGSEMYDQARQTVAQSYDRATEALSNTYDQAIGYGRENPGKFALIAFGAGIGVGLLLASAGASRSRTERIAEPVINALSQIAMEFIR